MARLDVVFSAEAHDDLNWLFTYISGASGYYRVAKAFTDRIVDQCERLGDYPDRGRSRPDLGTDLRSLPFESVVIIYMTQAGHVLIVRIFDGRRDYRAVLESDR